jgi:hypothetical protein
VGPALRFILAALGIVIAALLGWWTLELLIVLPMSAVAPTVTEVTGIAGASGIEGIVDGIVPTAWPWVALVGWILLLASSAFALATARRWKRGGRRFRTEADTTHTTGPVDAVDSWDDLSRGNDPTR